MAEGKKSFIMYCDLIHSMGHLSMSQRGQILTWILDYVNDKNPELPKGMLAAVIEPIKQQLKRDLKKYDSYIKKQSENGKKGGRPPKPKTQIKPKKGLGFLDKPNKAKKADSVNDTVNDTVNDINYSDFELTEKRRIIICNRYSGIDYSNALRNFIDQNKTETNDEHEIFKHFLNWLKYNDNYKCYLKKSSPL